MPERLFMLGIILFSVSLYILSFKEYIEGIRFIGIVTPFGGVSFIAAWLLTGYNVYKLNKK